MNKLALALASSAVAVAMADDPGNINFAEPREATYTNFNDNGGSTFTSYSELGSISPPIGALMPN